MGGRDTGGMSTFLRGLAGALGQAGHRVDIFTRAGATEKEETIVLAPGVRLIIINDGQGSLAKENIYPRCRLIARAVEDFTARKKCCYDLLFSHYWLSGCVGRVLQESVRVPHLIMFHTLGRAKNECCPAEKEPLRRLAEEERLARRCDLVVVAARLEEERVVSYFALPEEKLARITCGFDCSLFKPCGRREARHQLGWPAEEEEKIILSAGRIEPVKDLDLLLEASALLPAEDNFSLRIAGGDEHSRARVARLKEKAAALGLGGKVFFEGIVDHEKMPLYYSAASLTALTSCYESFGLAALESIACGTPVVGGYTGALPELVGKEREAGRFGYLVESRRPDKWAAKMRAVFLGGNAPAAEEIEEHLAPFSWEEAARLLVEKCRAGLPDRL
ncbi:MAG TPA: glycosyltransferase [Firmicutes bacterium]|nr:glycosyltransferase [Bacillota bacterium]